MLPTNQRLCSDALAALELDFGLVVETQFVALDRVSKVVAGCEFAEGALAKRFVENLVAVPAPLLGAMRRDVGVAQ